MLDNAKSSSESRAPSNTTILIIILALEILFFLIISYTVFRGPLVLPPALSPLGLRVITPQLLFTPFLIYTAMVIYSIIHFFMKTRGTMKSKGRAEAATVEPKAKPLKTPEEPSIPRGMNPINPPYAYSTIEKEESGRLRYVVIEPTLQEQEKKHMGKIKQLLFEEMDVDLEAVGTGDEVEKHLREKIRGLVKRHRIRIGQDTLEKITYYLVRDHVHYGKIDVFMRDPLIEDVSCDGPDVPIYVWHKEYESLPTNVVFKDEELEACIFKLAYTSGRHISIASPIVDASLPDGSRIQLTFRKEVTRKGGTFTIRKFRADPFTISDLINLKTLSAEMAAFFWYIIEKAASILVAGGTASGKTTTLNALSMFIPPESKIVSIEDTAELNLPHENWISSVERTGFGIRGGEAEITMFELLKAAMRQRPDYIIVGEVRGAEAYTLFQAMATGHGGMGSIHGESAEAVINRLTTKPMDIPKTLIPTLNMFVLQSKIRIEEKTTRRVTRVVEPVYDPESDDFDLNEVFSWEPIGDRFSALFLERSVTLRKISQTTGVHLSEIREELERRKTVLEWMVKNGIRNYKDVSKVVRNYYLNPQETYDDAKSGLST